ncbi:MAG: hypothetical protein JM58_00835 [Peptococcaceae bacterium BICA1-8]|nr:MAG: hypothetical protein JM58_00835 [Peptococcaceae bacterium BICA1-8]
MNLYKIILAGCGQSEDSQVSSEKQLETPQIELDTRKYNLEKYLQIKLGNTYEEVEAILGAPGEAMVDNDRLKQYQWTNEDNSNISVAFFDKKATGKSQAHLGSFLSGKNTVTLNKFEKLKEGMTLQEVTDILGSGTETMLIDEDGKEKVMMGWYNSDGSGISVTLFDGKIIDTKKIMLK